MRGTAKDAVSRCFTVRRFVGQFALKRNQRVRGLGLPRGISTFVDKMRENKCSTLLLHEKDTLRNNTLIDILPFPSPLFKYRR